VGVCKRDFRTHSHSHHHFLLVTPIECEDRGCIQGGIVCDLVLAAVSGPRVRRGGVTRSGRCTYRPSITC
jgi:hypothetical protein